MMQTFLIIAPMVTFAGSSRQFCSAVAISEKMAAAVFLLALLTRLTIPVGH